MIFIKKYKDIPFYASKTKNKYYAKTSRSILSNTTNTYLHHLVIGLPINKQWMICFKDGDTMNCTRENLQYIRRSDNTQKKSLIQHKRTKSSKYLGVTFVPAYFLARVKFDGKTLNIGTFKTEIEAAKAYNSYVEKLFGKNAKINNV